MEYRLERPISVPVIVAGLWLAAVFAVGFHTVRDAVRDERRQTVGPVWRSATNLVQSVQSDLLDHLWHKDEFLDANGGWTRLLGQRMCNGVLKLRNGHLSGQTSYRESAYAAEAINALSTACDDAGVSCLFVMFPYKIDPEQMVVPRGAPRDNANRMADDFLAALHQTEVLDLRPLVASSVEDVTRHFFRTDHHWNFKGAFKAFPAIARKILALLDEPDSGILALDAAYWEWHSMERPFTGTFARRTGPWFGGTDEIVYCVPSFETDILVDIPHRINRNSRGPFKDSVVWRNVFQKPESHYKDTGYSVYGSDRPLVRYLNATAPVRRRILVIKDSFAIPICAFLSTVFSEVVVMDMRWYHDVDAARYIRIMRPDIVSVMYNPRALANVSMWNFGLAGEPCESHGGTVLNLGNRQIQPKDRGYNFVVVQGGLRRSSLVKVTVGEVCSLAGECGAASVVLFERKNKRFVFEEKLVVGYPAPQTLLFRVPDDKGVYSILVYAGTIGKTHGNGLGLSDISIEIEPAEGDNSAP